MSQDRIKKIKERLQWLQMQLTHEGYLDGYSIEGFKKEVDKLLAELKTLEENK
jgi:hypothetical protein